MIASAMQPSRALACAIRAMRRDRIPAMWTLPFGGIGAIPVPGGDVSVKYC
jgi:hypothetical protein